jgi:hypothetical protein
MFHTVLIYAWSICLPSALHSRGSDAAYSCATAHALSRPSIARSPHTIDSGDISPVGLPRSCNCSLCLCLRNSSHCTPQPCTPPVHAARSRHQAPDIYPAVYEMTLVLCPFLNLWFCSEISRYRRHPAQIIWPRGNQWARHHTHRSLQCTHWPCTPVVLQEAHARPCPAC